MYRLTLLLLLFCIQVQAASFDCEKAQGKYEKLICNDRDLSSLDRNLSDEYVALKQYVHTAEERQKVTVDQLQWLKETRDRCNDVACLKAVYRARMIELNPISDNHLTCATMRRFPKFIFNGDIDLGSGYGSPTQVDYDCPESLNKQPFMKTLLDLAEIIRPDKGPQICTGSRVQAEDRYFGYKMAWAGIAPALLPRSAVAVGTSAGWDAVITAAVKNPDNEHKDVLENQDDRTLVFFKRWSEESPANFDLYRRFTAEFDRVLPILAKHYQSKFGFSEAAAHAAAHNALMLIVNRAADWFGDFGREELKQDNRLVTLARNPQTTLDDMQRELSRHPPDAEFHSKQEIYHALIVALLNRRSVQMISLLGDRLAPGDFEGPSDASEPVLAYSIGRQRNLGYLLRRKAAVNDQNAYGKTPLFYAVEASDFDAVKALLKAGADVNRVYQHVKDIQADDEDCSLRDNHTGSTPFMHAAQSSNVNMLKLLIAAGANVSVADDLGFNALDFAVLGKNKNNENYLKTLGLTLGSPEYNSKSDPAVREHKFDQVLAIDGIVSSIRISPIRPSLLVAAVNPIKATIANNTGALYLISISDRAHPKVISRFPGKYINRFQLSPNGELAFVQEWEFNERGTGHSPEMKIIDIKNAEQPALLREIMGDYEAMQLSSDGKQLYLQGRATIPGPPSDLLVYDVGHDGATLRCKNPFRSDDGKSAVVASSFTTFPDEPLLLVYTGGTKSLLFDVKEPCAPKRLSEVNVGYLEESATGLAGRIVVSPGLNELQTFRLADKAVRMAVYRGGLIGSYVDTKTGSVAGYISGDLAIFRTNLQGQFVLTDRFRLGDEFRRLDNLIYSIRVDSAGHVYAGWSGGLGVGFVPAIGHAENR